MAFPSGLSAAAVISQLPQRKSTVSNRNPSSCTSEIRLARKVIGDSRHHQLPPLRSRQHSSRHVAEG